MAYSESTERGAEREIRDMEARLSGRFWTVGAGERLATVMWRSPARDRTQQKNGQVIREYLSTMRQH